MAAGGVSGRQKRCPNLSSEVQSRNVNILWKNDRSEKTYLVSVNKPENAHVSGSVLISEGHTYITKCLKVTFGEFFLFILLREGKRE